ncbi:virulence RhuM family protein [Pedobacter sp. SD-b]|uniref:Virulence RhuM family protein n=1 Tax=Pedobacter segetis TaxID=2793069 RepID=A0ABS1BET3_9SPHI|nr:virulence RhuM family protein [Pedobacter segetis]MBK0381382.1 virulence RhuM family protein [Pedobacter segetis]
MGQLPDKSTNFLLYHNQNAKVTVEVVLGNETVWLTQKTMSELFAVNVPAISKHLTNIFDEGELDENSVISILETTASDGKKYKTKFYNLDAIISVGYRVSSAQATQFRIWATKTLKEYIIKGFTVDSERLKQGGNLFDKDYFDELLEKIREIRASERRFYQKITDIYSLAVDYNKNAPITKDFFASVQNKLHWAITGKTAAEIIYAQVDAKKLYMGLQTWKNAPEGKIIKTDTTVAKNYLSEKHIKELERMVSAYLDLAENRAERGILMKMEDWVQFLDNFLELSNYPILQNKEKISQEQAKLKAENEFEKFRITQDKNFVSDFDKEVKKLKKKK